jgi:hypothetical protein
MLKSSTTNTAHGPLSLPPPPLCLSLFLCVYVSLALFGCVPVGVRMRSSIRLRGRVCETLCVCVCVCVCVCMAPRRPGKGLAEALSCHVLHGLHDVIAANQYFTIVPVEE